MEELTANEAVMRLRDLFRGPCNVDTMACARAIMTRPDTEWREAYGTAAPYVDGRYFYISPAWRRFRGPCRAASRRRALRFVGCSTMQWADWVQIPLALRRKIAHEARGPIGSGIPLRRWHSPVSAGYVSVAVRLTDWVALQGSMHDRLLYSIRWSKRLMRDPALHEAAGNAARSHLAMLCRNSGQGWADCCGVPRRWSDGACPRCGEYECAEPECRRNRDSPHDYCEDHRYECCDCGSRDDVENVYGELLCGDCRTICEVCGEYCRQSSVDEQGHCEECRDEHRRSYGLSDYDAQPSSMIAKIDRAFLPGTEDPAEGPIIGIEYEHYTEVDVDLPDGWLHCYDSSVDGEVKTRPATWKWWQAHHDTLDLLDNAGATYRSGAGIHVHIDRRCLDTSDVLALARLLCGSVVARMAHRDHSDLVDFAEPIGELDNGRKYVAVNTEHRKTIEIRIWRSGDAKWAWACVVATKSMLDYVQDDRIPTDERSSLAAWAVWAREQDYAEDVAPVTNRVPVPEVSPCA